MSQHSLIAENTVDRENWQDDLERLSRAGLRPSRHRLAILRRIREGGRRHLVPESLHCELTEQGLSLSLATVYNTINSFAEAGLLRRVGFCDKTFYCTNLEPHHHFYEEITGQIFDVAGEQPQIVNLPEPPPGMELRGIDIIFHVRRKRD